MGGNNITLNDIQTQPWSTMKKLLQERIAKFHPKKIIPSLEKQKLLKVEEIKGTEIRAIVNQKIPYVKLDDNGEKSGYVIELWSILQEILQFRTIFKKIENVADQKKALRQGLGDIILNPVIPSAQDLDDFNHTIPITNTWYQLYVKEDSNKVSSNLYFNTWKLYLWYAFIATIITLTFILWLLHAIRYKVLPFDRVLNTIDSIKIYFGLDEMPFTQRKKKTIGWNEEGIDKNTEHVDSSFGNCFLCIFGAVTNQGSQMMSNNDSVRILNLISLFFGLLMYSSYSGVLVSKLTISGPGVVFASLESIVEANTHKLCISETSFAFEHFKKRGSNTEIASPWNSIVNRKPCHAGKLDLVPMHDYCTSKTVVLETPQNKNLLWGSNTPKCRIAELKGSYFYTSITLLVRKGFNYTNLINTYLLRLQSTGVADRIEEKWFPSKPHENIHEIDYAVTWKHIKDIFYLFCATCFISILLLFVELGISKSFIAQKKKLKNKLKSTISNVIVESKK